MLKKAHDVKEMKQTFMIVEMNVREITRYAVHKNKSENL